MQKKSLFIIILLIVSTISVSAQFSPKTKGLASFARFNKTETYFVLTEREELNEAIKTATIENWSLTKINFIEEDSFLLISKDRDKSFIYFHKMKKQGVGKKIKVLALVNGGYDQKATYISNTLAFISLDNDAYEANDLDIIFRLPNLVTQLQDIVKIVKENNIIEKTEQKVRNKMIKLYNKKSGAIKDKTLLVDKRYLSQKIVSEKEFYNIYKYEVMFASKEFITKSINEKDPRFCYLISAVNLFKINTVNDCETGEILYADFEEEDKISKDFDRNFSRDDIFQLVGNIRAAK